MNKFEIKEVALNVKNLKKMTDFYHEVLGLPILEESEEEVLLGQPNIRLVKGASAAVGTRYFGLYHTAFLLPSDAHLGAFLQHVLDANTELTGAGDHLYSQAIYLNDPEGNGIEVYADRPRSEWVIHEDGHIDTATLEVDIPALLAAGKETTYDLVPQGTTIGHVHLEIGNVKEAREFYVEELGFEIKTSLGNSALFVSKNGYHHDFGLNNWLRSYRNREAHETGLLYVEILDDSLEPGIKVDPFGTTIRIINS